MEGLPILLTSYQRADTQTLLALMAEERRVHEQNIASVLALTFASTRPDGKHDLAFRPGPQAFEHEMSLARVRER